MSLTVRKTDLHLLNLRARMPFRYGQATLTAVPQAYLRVVLEVDGRAQTGLAADVLPPMWFEKDPNKGFREEVADMLHVLETAAAFSEQVGPADTPFDLWQAIYIEQMRWGNGEGYPPLLWGFGVSLVERAVVDAFCRARGTPLATAIRENTLGVQLGEIHQELADQQPAELLPERPRESLAVRHTVGLSDPLTDMDIPDEQRLDDGLPQSLEACIRTYGLTHFKIKLSGERDRDLERLRRLAGIIRSETRGNYAVTLDGNEQYRDVESFQSVWEAIVSDAALEPFLQRLRFVEQPLHRDVALAADATEALLGWEGRPPIIIDESDGMPGSAADALDSGYVGTSHKNCKGLFRGIANACLVTRRRRDEPQGPYGVSGEDLAYVGPVALLQDLAALANLGIDHAERNGHHYFRGLSMFPAEIREATLNHHGDLFRNQRQSFPTLAIRSGTVDLRSVVAAPFGTAFEVAPELFTPVDAWRFESLQEDPA